MAWRSPVLDWTQLISRLAAIVILIAPASVAACPLCYEAARRAETIGQRLDSADRVVLALPVESGAQFRIIDIVKGEDAVGGVIAVPLTSLDTANVAGSDPQLLVHNQIPPGWSSLGRINAEHADWLRQLTATLFVEGDRPRAAWPVRAASSMLSYTGWGQRIALILPYLENPDPLAALIAWGELARAPYAVLDVARSNVDPEVLQRWLNDPRLKSRRAAYLLLLGFTGNAADAAHLERDIEVAWNAHDATELSAMIGADLELRGPARVDWVEMKYFADRLRTMPEIEAALLALNVHGEANRTIPRERVIQAYRRFIKERPAMAGFVAPQLADWDYWGATADYATLLESKAIKDPASELAVVMYLKRAALAKVTRP